MSHSVSLSWNQDTDPVAGYNVFRSTTAGTENTTPINSALVTGLTYVDTTVTAGTTYFYVVRGVSASGVISPNSNEFEAQVPLSAPTGLTGVVV